MSASNAGGVRNLRAMFENKNGDHSTSPPSRGRSPSSSAVSGNSRPVSKVRASFVAVEKPGDLGQPPQWGLRKASDVSSVVEVTEGGPGGPDTSHNTTSTEATTNMSHSASTPNSPHMSKDAMDGGIGAIMRGSSFESDTSKKISQPAESEGGVKEKSNGVGSRAADMVKKMQSKDKPQSPPATKLKTTPTAQPVKNPNPKPAQHKGSPESPSSPKKSVKTPTSPVAPRMNIRGGPAKIRGVLDSAKRASDAREAMKKEDTSRSTEQPKKEAPAPGNPKTNGVKKEAASSPKSATGPKSPTSFAKLPAAATTGTAASAAHQKKETSSQAAHKKPASRPSAVHSQPPRVANSTTASSLAKKSSRASLANDNERSKSRTSLSQPTESFLSRMSRPTASSAQKTHEKTQPTSPPRSRNVSSTSKSKAPSRTSLKGVRKSDGSEKEKTVLEPTAEAAENEAPSTASAQNHSADKTTNGESEPISATIGS